MHSITHSITTETYIARESTIYRTHMSCKLSNFSVLDLIRCKYDQVITEIGNQKYYVIPATPATGLLYITKNNPEFISGKLE